MCGIAAIFNYSNAPLKVDGEELLRVRDRMITRGPDGAGIWLSDDGKVGLAHRRLAIIEVGSAGAQPMSLKDEIGNIQLEISFNGEIYNYLELKNELIGKGRRFDTNSDTEVLLQLYDEYGPDMLYRLRGMFAFAIWDVEKKGMFLARDPYGIKPLYYSDNGNTLRLASQVKALLSGGAISQAPNPAGHIGFFTLGYVPEPHTMYRDIYSLSAGTYAWFDCTGKKEFNTYFCLRTEMIKLEKQNLDVPPLHLRNALLESAEHHLVSDVPVGVFLSAGLDSSSILAYAAEISKGPIETITLNFDEFSGSHADESPLAKEVAGLFQSNHHASTIDAEDFSIIKSSLIESMDQPSIDGVNTYFVAREASRKGLKVALSGVGGDEIFGGYDTFKQVPSIVKNIGWIPGIRNFGRVFRKISGPLLKQLTSPKYASLFEYSSDYGSAYILRRGLFLPWELPEFLDKTFVEEGWKNLNLNNMVNESIDGISLPKNKVSALESQWYMKNQLLRDADWAGMAHSCEIRTPLIDSFLFKKIAGRAFNKTDMAGGLKRPLPNKLINRPKTGFAIPVQDWILSDRTDDVVDRGIRGWAKIVYKENFVT